MTWHTIGFVSHWLYIGWWWSWHFTYVISDCVCINLAHWFNRTSLCRLLQKMKLNRPYEKKSYDLFSLFSVQYHIISFFWSIALSLLNVSQANLSIQHIQTEIWVYMALRTQRIQAFEYLPTYHSTSQRYTHKYQSIWFGLRKQPLRVHRLTAFVWLVVHCLDLQLQSTHYLGVEKCNSIHTTVTHDTHVMDMCCTVRCVYCVAFRQSDAEKQRESKKSNISRLNLRLQ